VTGVFLIVAIRAANRAKTVSSFFATKCVHNGLIYGTLRGVGIHKMHSTLGDSDNTNRCDLRLKRKPGRFDGACGKTVNVMTKV